MPGTQNDVQFIIIFALRALLSLSLSSIICCVLKFIFLDTKSYELRQKTPNKIKAIFAATRDYACMHMYDAHQAC